jgi:ribosomal protein L11 methyltransferase
MDYIELNFKVKPALPFEDILTAELAELGFESFVSNENGLLAYIQYPAFDAKKLDELIADLQEKNCSVAFKQNVIKSQNWNASWESSFEPIDVLGQCRVRAPFHEKIASYSYDIVIEPKMSFGTGHHETTFMMLQQLLQLDLQNKAVLDMGCGTSVLAILAAKRKAKSVLAIDNDSWSYENSIENCVLNGCPEIEVKLGDAGLLKSNQFDLILANINRNILMQDMSIYSESLKEKGELFLSGFFDVDAELLIACAEKLKLKFKQKQSKNQWALLHFQK